MYGKSLALARRRIDKKTMSERFRKGNTQRQRWAEALGGIDGVEIPGEKGTAPRTPVIPLHVTGHAPDHLAAELDARLGVRCRSGLQCAPLAHRYLGTLDAGGTLRIAPGEETGSEIIDPVCSALTDLIC